MKAEVEQNHRETGSASQSTPDFDLNVFALHLAAHLFGFDHVKDKLQKQQKKPVTFYWRSQSWTDSQKQEHQDPPSTFTASSTTKKTATVSPLSSDITIEKIPETTDANDCSNFIDIQIGYSNQKLEIVMGVLYNGQYWNTSISTVAELKKLYPESLMLYDTPTYALANVLVKALRNVTSESMSNYKPQVEKSTLAVTLPYSSDWGFREPAMGKLVLRNSTFALDLKADVIKDDDVSSLQPTIESKLSPALLQMIRASFTPTAPNNRGFDASQAPLLEQTFAAWRAQYTAATAAEHPLFRGGKARQRTFRRAYALRQAQKKTRIDYKQDPPAPLLSNEQQKLQKKKLVAGCE